MKPEEINVEVQNGQLWISGEKKEEKEEKGKTYHRVERRYGSFRRMLPIPASVDPEKVEASFREGVLKITLAKTEEAKAKHVEVKS
jgi:HSP20 family protein